MDSLFLNEHEGTHVMGHSAIIFSHNCVLNTRALSFLESSRVSSRVYLLVL